MTDAGRLYTMAAVSTWGTPKLSVGDELRSRSVLAEAVVDTLQHGPLLVSQRCDDGVHTDFIAYQNPSSSG